MVMIMDKLRSVVNLSTYGKVSIHLKEILETQGLTRYRLSKLADTRFEVVEKWCNGTVERIDKDVLARFCYILNCQVSDILRYDEENSHTKEEQL